MNPDYFEDMAERQASRDAYESIDWYEEGKDADREREEGLIPCDGNYSLDDLPF